jgi:large subunit ribosomal protein L21
MFKLISNSLKSKNVWNVSSRLASSSTSGSIHKPDSNVSETPHADRDRFFNHVNQLIDQGHSKRHFAVVHMYGVQHFVREGDVFKVNSQVPAKLGERIKLEKCLMAGSDSYTLIGRPLLDRNQVNVEVTVVEVTQSHSINRHIFTQRSQGHKRWRFVRHPITLLRVNSIEIKHGINQNPTEI